MFFSVGGTCWGWSIFSQFFLSIFIWGHAQNINSQLSQSCYVMIDHHVIQIFYILLLPLTSIASSGFHRIFVIDSIQKCEYRFKDKRFSVWIKECFLFLSKLFSEVGYMNVNWMCLFAYLKYKFASTYLFLFLSITTYNTSV